MKYDENAGYFISHIRLLNARLFNKLLSEEENAKYSAEQGKILSALWIKNPQTATDISIKTGLANNTLSNMLKKLEEQGLIRERSFSVLQMKVRHRKKLAGKFQKN